MELPEDQVLNVHFEQRSLYNKAKSEGEVLLDLENKPVESTRIIAAGRPIFEDVDFVVIMIPGDNDSVIERPAKYCGAEPCKAVRQTDCDVHRFPRQWTAYRQGKSEQHEGTDLKEWPGATRSQVETLGYHKVYTVEQLASMSDSNAEKFLVLRQRARDYLTAAEKQAGFTQLRSEMDAKDIRIQTLERQVEQLAAKGKDGAKATETTTARPT